MLRLVLASLLVGCKANAPIQAPEPAPIAVIAPRDHDGDGFLDPQDACPEVPGIAPDGCPARDPDGDGDGFLGAVDLCPDEPGVEPGGCPILDADGDSILDLDDMCPTGPETRNGYLDIDGCPEEIPKDLAKITGTIHGIYFDLDKDTIKPKSRPVLDRAVQTLKNYPEVRIGISGHTDDIPGAPTYGRQLSLRRANAVKKYLVEHGIDDGRIETRGADGDEPIDTIKTARGRARNRRIEFAIQIQ